MPNLRTFLVVEVRDRMWSQLLRRRAEMCTWLVVSVSEIRM